MPKRILGVLSGRDLPDVDLVRWASAADEVIATDSAGDRLHFLGIRPHLVLGDMDSSHLEWESMGVSVKKLLDQDSSDCDKLLEHLARLGSPAAIAGIEGDRIDHVLASFSSVARSTVPLQLVLRRGLGIVVRSGRPIARQVPLGSRFSVIPYPSAQDVEIEGGEWPLSSEDLALGGRISLSNRASAPLVRVSVSAGSAIAIFETPGAPLPEWGEPFNNPPQSA